VHVTDDFEMNACEMTPRLRSVEDAARSYTGRICCDYFCNLLSTVVDFNLPDFNPVTRVAQNILKAFCLEQQVSFCISMQF